MLSFLHTPVLQHWNKIIRLFSSLCNYGRYLLLYLRIWMLWIAQKRMKLVEWMSCTSRKEGEKKGKRGEKKKPNNNNKKNISLCFWKRCVDQMSGYQLLWLTLTYKHLVLSQMTTDEVLEFGKNLEPFFSVLKQVEIHLSTCISLPCSLCFHFPWKPTYSHA